MVVTILASFSVVSSRDSNQLLNLGKDKIDESKSAKVADESEGFLAKFCMFISPLSVPAVVSPPLLAFFLIIL